MRGALAAALALALAAAGRAQEVDGPSPAAPPITIDPMESQRHLEREQSKRILSDVLEIMNQLEAANSLSPEAALAIMGDGAETEMLRKALEAIREKGERDEDGILALLESRVEAVVSEMIAERAVAGGAGTAAQPQAGGPAAGGPGGERIDSLVTLDRGRNAALSVVSMTVVEPVRIAVMRLLDDGVTAQVTIVRRGEEFRHDGNLYRVLSAEPQAAGWQMEMENVTTGEQFELRYSPGQARRGAAAPGGRA